MRAGTEENILEYLKPQGVTHVKRFTIRKNNEIINTNTLLLTFNSVVISVESLYVEAEDPSLYLRREKLALQYAIRLAANPSNPTFKVIFAPHIAQDLIDLYDNKPNAIRSFGLRIAPLLTSANINKEQIETQSVSEIPSWCIRKPIIDLALHSEKKSESNPHLLKLQSYYSDHEHIYTDGSKDEENKYIFNKCKVHGTKHVSTS